MKAPLTISNVLVLAAGMAAGPHGFAAEAQPRPIARHQPVLALQPIGYWPADEGAGMTLHDRSGKGNHGKVYHVPWEHGLLNYTSGFQWAEIPGHEAYRSEAFTIGGWLFSRRGAYRRNGMLFMGMANPIRLWISPSVILRIRQENEIEVLSNGKADAIGSKAGKCTIAINAWQHVIYTCEGGTGKLYLNGELVKTAGNVSFEGRKQPLLVGSCADWWMLHPPGSNSLNGSVRDLVLFDRALKPEEVARLAAATRPNTRPRVREAGAIVIDNREVRLDDLLMVPVRDQRRALAQLGKRDTQELRAVSGVLLPILARSLEQRQTRRAAARLLMKLGNGGARVLLRETMPRLLQMLQADTTPREERAACALALAEMKAEARDAVPTLIAALEGVLDPEGVRLPRVEDVLRNALIRALLDIDPRDARARAVVGRALAKPLLDSMDLAKPYLADVQTLVGQGRYPDALDRCRALAPSKHGDRFFSQGDRQRDERGWYKLRDYSAAAEADGRVYRVGKGIAWEGCERVPVADYEQVVAALAGEYPEVRTWRSADHPHLYRTPITRTDGDGKARKVYLEGDRFIFDGTDGKVRAWSIAVDRNGYVHVTGGQHNAPNPGAFIPGSWERIGLSRDRTNDAFPSQLYWVSEKPHSIDSFEFVGQRASARRIPAEYLNYMNFAQDNNRELFLYGRTNVAGRQSWGLYRYDAETRRWTALGGNACDVIAAAKHNAPGWAQYLIRAIRGAVPTEPGPEVLAWAWQPHFYNYCRSNWGIRFDRTNRMHVQLPIRGLGQDVRIIDSSVYAYSDDGGRTFWRADGSKLKLPLTVNPAPAHLADVNGHLTQEYWELWLSLLRQAAL